MRKENGKTLVLHLLSCMFYVAELSNDKQLGFGLLFVNDNARFFFFFRFWVTTLRSITFNVTQRQECSVASELQA